jgi:hypothetical protein
MRRRRMLRGAITVLAGALAAGPWLTPDAGAGVRALAIDGQRPRAEASAEPVNWDERGRWGRADRHDRWEGSGRWGHRHWDDWRWRHGHRGHPWPPSWHPPGPWPGAWRPAPVWVPGGWVWTGWGWAWVPSHWR